MDNQLRVNIKAGGDGEHFNLYGEHAEKFLEWWGTPPEKPVKVEFYPVRAGRGDTFAVIPKGVRGGFTRAALKVKVVV